MKPVDLSTFHPATDLLIGSLRETITQIREHQHPERGGDLFCLNLSSFMGERMGPVLRRLVDEQAETRKWQEKHTALADQFQAEIDRFKPATMGRYQIFIHGCGHVEPWDESTYGPINEQGCDACESAPDGSWQLVYVREDGTR